MNKEHKKYYIGGFGLCMIIAGLLLNFFNVGIKNTFGYSTVGNYLMNIGFIGLILAVFLHFKKHERKVDERMISAALSSARLTFVFVIAAAFVILVIDQINTINVPIGLFMSYFICCILIAHVITYKIILWKM